MRLRTLIILMICVFLLSVGGTALFFSFYSIVEVKTVEANVLVDEYVGINLDTDKLYFGTVIPGGRANRVITLTKSSEERLKVEIRVEGPLEGYLTAKKNGWWMENSSQDVDFEVRIPRDMPHGNYSSTVRFIFLRGLFS